MPQSDLFQRISAENFDHTYFVYTSNYTLRADSFVELPGSFCGLDKLFLTEGYFTHIFSKAIGISPMKYIRLMRLSEAETLLKKGMSVSEVSKKCGYANPTAFWKAIKREYGCTPSELKSR